ncbi:hypothetical protein [Vibrio antiquarius]|nr:hypothetical protein [Vibrio antiquarius]
MRIWIFLSHAVSMNARNDHSIGKVGSSANGHVFCINALLVNGY